MRVANVFVAVLISVLCSLPAAARALVLGPITTIDQPAGFQPINIRSANGVVVWEHKLNSEQSRIRAWESSSGVRTVRASNSSAQAVFRPDISGRNVVWCEAVSSGNISKVSTFNLDTNVTSDVTTPSAGQLWTSIENNRVVWSQLAANGRDDVFVTTLGSGSAQPVANDLDRFESAPDIQGNRVIHNSIPTSGGAGIRVIDLATSASIFQRDLAASDAHVYEQPRPMIDGDTIGWFQNVGFAPLELHVVKLSTNQEWVLPNCERAAMSNGVIVWTDNVQDKILALDTLTGTTNVLRNLPFDDNPSLTLDGLRMTWIEFAGTSGNYNVMTAMIPEPASLGVVIIFAVMALRRRWR